MSSVGALNSLNSNTDGLYKTQKDMTDITDALTKLMTANGDVNGLQRLLNDSKAETARQNKLNEDKAKAEAEAKQKKNDTSIFGNSNNKLNNSFPNNFNPNDFNPNDSTSNYSTSTDPKTLGLESDLEQAKNKATAANKAYQTAHDGIQTIMGTDIGREFKIGLQ